MTDLGYTTMLYLYQESIPEKFPLPQAVRKRHFEAYHSWQSRYCDST